MSIVRITTKSAAETQRVAATLASRLKPGTVIALHGDLGSGKTCFTQGLAAALGIQSGVSSPTYTLIHEYRGRFAVHHVDLYRVNDTEEAMQAGLEDLIYGTGITVIEWPDRVAGLLPPQTIHVYLHMGDAPNERQIEIAEVPRP